MDLFAGFGGYGWAAIAILIIVLTGGWFLGRKIGLRRPLDWFPLWAFSLALSMASLKAGSSLSGWLTVISFLGFFINVWLCIRSELPVWVDGQ